MPSGRTLLLGLGRFGGGVACARYLHGQGHRLRIADQASAESLRASIQALQDLSDLEWRLGGEDPQVLQNVDLLVVNPAVPPQHPLLQAASKRGIPQTQEASLFLQAYPGRVTVVTGTNGKSSTATLLAAALRRSGMDTLLGGNIGHSLLADQQQWSAQQHAVLELSSFQLERMDPQDSPVHGTVMTSLGSDHLDRHGGLDQYHQAKARAAAMAQEFFVHLAGDAVAQSMSSPARRRLVYGGAELEVTDGWLMSHAQPDPGRLLHADALQVLGDFQALNCLAAFAAAQALGAKRHAAALAMCISKPLPHRLQLLSQVDGVKLYDNGISTQWQSTANAFASLGGRVHWVGGGRSKAREPEQELQEVARRFAPHICSAHLFGSVAPRLRDCLQARQILASSHIHLEQALDAAWAQARPGDAILFSPAFASFDQYPNFQARAAGYLRWADQRKAMPQVADGEQAQG